MFNTDVYIDQIFSDADLADAFGHAYGISPDHVAIVNSEDHEGLGNTWRQARVQLLLQTARIRGDFPIAIGLWIREDTPDLRALLVGAAQALEASILTDEFEVNPLSDSEWLMLTPDGHAIVVHADDEEFGAEDPAIILTPESRDLYKAHQPPAGSFAAPV